eukprot:TRINITY_DN47406_c0_g1_i1.p1 TRINITY_DN47406_c0_g1~~TRINITY_DN47406_c0_g1_i1.p1  ORF type:complete len:173 (+),score=30.24 TRINITY_DN47406_c0_g1_i1:1585-2103(+)
MLFDTIYARSEICLVLPGDNADATKRLWDAMTRACLPAFASGQPDNVWPVLPFADTVEWSSFAFFFHAVNSTLKAQRVLSRLAAVSKEELRQRRATMQRWLPMLVLERTGCGWSWGGRSSSGLGGVANASSRSSPPSSAALPSALELALAEVFRRSVGGRSEFESQALATAD